MEQKPSSTRGKCLLTGGPQKSLDKDTKFSCNILLGFLLHILTINLDGENNQNAMRKRFCKMFIHIALQFKHLKE